MHMSTKFIIPLQSGEFEERLTQYWLLKMDLTPRTYLVSCNQVGGISSIVDSFLWFIQKKFRLYEQAICMSNTRVIIQVLKGDVF